MPEFNFFAKILILVGVIFIISGIIFLLVGKLPYIGKLPGDIIIHRKNFSFYFPVTTCILVSIILSFIFWLLMKR
jgi:hypothetical protein